jgi:hypothetical protein
LIRPVGAKALHNKHLAHVKGFGPDHETFAAFPDITPPSSGLGSPPNLAEEVRSRPSPSSGTFWHVIVGQMCPQRQAEVKDELGLHKVSRWKSRVLDRNTAERCEREGITLKLVVAENFGGWGAALHGAPASYRCKQWPRALREGEAFARMATSHGPFGIPPRRPPNAFGLGGRRPSGFSGPSVGAIAAQPILDPYSAYGSAARALAQFSPVEQGYMATLSGTANIHSLFRAWPHGGTL